MGYRAAVMFWIKDVSCFCQETRHVWSSFKIITILTELTLKIIFNTVDDSIQRSVGPVYVSNVLFYIYIYIYISKLGSF
jgi:hypothetical protein